MAVSTRNPYKSLHLHRNIIGYVSTRHGVAHAHNTLCQYRTPRSTRVGQYGHPMLPRYATSVPGIV
eukprot:1280367-Rhodomonas_salina.1